MSIEVKIFGGPHDGLIYAVPDGSEEICFYEADTDTSLSVSRGGDEPIPVQGYYLPIRYRIADRAVALWSDRVMVEENDVKLEDIIEHGNRGHHHNTKWGRDNEIECTDGFTLSVIAGGGTYCHPKPRLCVHPWSDEPPLVAIKGLGVECDYPGPYTEIEVGYPSERPEPWDEWKQWCESPDEPTKTVYGFVPVSAVRALVASHGGEAGEEHR